MDSGHANPVARLDQNVVQSSSPAVTAWATGCAAGAARTTCNAGAVTGRRTAAGEDFPAAAATAIGLLAGLRVDAASVGLAIGAEVGAGIDVVIGFAADEAAVVFGAATATLAGERKSSSVRKHRDGRDHVVGLLLHAIRGGGALVDPGRRSAAWRGPSG
ncbi:hypothetical protein Ddc_18803 [Ditylenchus destructor]|nr:hypothetical protein Ddc_18803 [Ditylenchus destructor]